MRYIPGGYIIGVIAFSRASENRLAVEAAG